MEYYPHKLVAFLFVIVLASGCGFLKPSNDYPDDKGSSAPSIGEKDEEGRVSYRPNSDPERDYGIDDPYSNQDAGYSSDTSDTSEADANTDTDTESEEGLRCLTEDLLIEVPPETVEEKAVKGFYKIVDMDETIDTPLALMNSDYLHLVSVKLKITSGADFDFIDWVEMYHRSSSIRIAWGGPFPENAREVDLTVNGSVDLASYLEEKITLDATVRAKSPSRDTDIGAEVIVRKFYDCQ